MRLEQLFHQLLGLAESWEVVGLQVLESDGTVQIEVREKPALWESAKCPDDGERLRPYGHGQTRRWRHLNIFEYRCEIVCALPRGRCAKCARVRTIEAPWEGMAKGFTLAFEAMCLLLMRDMPVKRVAGFVGEHDTRLWRLLQRHVDKARAEKDMSEVTAVACDELAVAKGHVYASVFADAQKREVLFATQTREEYTWKRFADDLKAHGGDPLAVKWASMDMSRSYQAGARWQVPNAQLVFDKFHVIKLAGDAVDQVRRSESKWLPSRAQELKSSRYLWLKNPRNLSDKQENALEQLSRLNLKTAKAYQMRLSLQDIYRHTLDPLRAHRRIRAWARWTRIAAAKDSLLKPMARVGRTLLKHLDGILAHWESRLTNAFMEGLMSVFSATKRKARGYRSFAYLRDMLYFTGSNLNIPTQPLFNAL